MLIRLTKKQVKSLRVALLIAERRLELNKNIHTSHVFHQAIEMLKAINTFLHKTRKIVKKEKKGINDDFIKRNTIVKLRTK